MFDKYKNIGEILGAARREQGKTLKNAAESTKIMEHYLVALETGDPKKLPSLAYFDLFARSYAQYLGIDASIFEEIDDKTQVDADSSSKEAVPLMGDPETAESASKAHARRFGRSLIYLVSAIIIIFIAFILYNQFFVESDNNSEPRETNDSYIGDQQSPSADKQNPPELIIPDASYEPPEKLKLYLIAKQDVWAVLVRDGDTVLNRGLKVGNERRWEADYRYHLTLGISTAVDIYVNDLKLAPLTDRPRTISGFEINQINYKDFYPKTDNTNNPPVTQQSTSASIETNRINEPSSPGRQIENPEDTMGEGINDGN